MRTLRFMPEAKQREKALETMEVYAPIAHRLGIRAVKEELEDLALHYLDPVACQEIEQTLEMNKSERLNFVKNMQERILARLHEYDIEPHIEGRVKSLYGIYRKVYMLSLIHIFGKRADGYHLMDMVMQSVSLCDTLQIARTEKDVSFSCSDQSLPQGSDNLAVRAASAFFKAAGKMCIRDRIQTERNRNHIAQKRKQNEKPVSFDPLQHLFERAFFHLLHCAAPPFADTPISSGFLNCDQ